MATLIVGRMAEPMMRSGVATTKRSHKRVSKLPIEVVEQHQVVRKRNNSV